MLHLNHIRLAHFFWEHTLLPTSFAIDATCGNGKDTKKLAELTPNGGVIALDIQKEALENTKRSLEDSMLTSKIHFFHQSHEEFPLFALELTISLIIYNLGYLPGGDKSLTTQTSSTLKSLSQALSLIVPGGMISVTCYPGHPEGLIEKNAVLEKTSSLNPAQFSAYHYHNIISPTAPSLLIIKKLKHY
ncbi:MAG: class I SAM-dependent methyltransferase [Chlamydiota bacterium]